MQTNDWAALAFREGTVVNCWNCHHEMQGQMRFCPNCGASQAQDAESAQPTAVIPLPPPTGDPVAPAVPQQAQFADLEPPFSQPGPPQQPGAEAWQDAQPVDPGAPAPRSRSRSTKVIALAVAGGVVALGATAAAAVAVFSHGSKNLTISGKPIQEPEQVLDQVAQQVLSRAQSDADTKFTSAPDYRCYFATRAGTDGDSVPVLEDVYCGPLLHQFGDAGAPFDSVPLKYDTSGAEAVVKFSAKGMGDEVNEGVSADKVTLLNEKGKSVSATALAPLEPPPPPTMDRGDTAVYSADDRYDTDEFDKDCTAIGVINGGSACITTKLGQTGGSGTDARSAPDTEQVATVTVFCRTGNAWTLKFGTGKKAPTAELTCDSGEFVEVIAAVKTDVTAAVALAGEAKTGPTIDLTSGKVAGSSTFVEAYGDTSLSLSAEASGSVSSIAHARADTYSSSGPDNLTATSPGAWFYADHPKCRSNTPCLAVSWELYSSSKPNPWLEFEPAQLDVTVGGRPAQFKIGRVYGNYAVYISGVTPNKAQTVRVRWTPKGKLYNRDDATSYDYWSGFSGNFTVTAQVPGPMTDGGDES